jgi:glutathione S-transferase
MSEDYMADIELFSKAVCPYAQRSQMALIEKGLPFRVIEIDTDNKPIWFKDVSPYGKVPVLRHGDTLVYESRIVNEYLDEAFPTPPLLPHTPAARAQARIWIDYCDTQLLPVMSAFLIDRRNPEKQTKNREVLRQRFRFIEEEGFRKLSNGPYWLGDEVSLVDLQFMPMFERLPCYVELWDAPSASQFPRLQAWISKMQQRPSHQRTARSYEEHMAIIRRLSAAA